MGTVFISHSSDDAYFVNLLEAVLTYSGVSVWCSSSGITPGLAYERKINAALETAETLIVVISRNSANSAWVKHECRVFLEQHRDSRVIPTHLDATKATEINVGLEQFHNIDFSKCMLTGFTKLLKAFGLEFHYQDKRAPKRVDRRKGVDRRDPANLHRRVRVGFWKAFVQATGYGEFQELSLLLTTKYKVIQSLAPEAAKYEFKTASGQRCDSDEVLKNAVEAVWLKWRELEKTRVEPIGAAYVIEDIATAVCAQPGVTVAPVGRRRAGERREDSTQGPHHAPERPGKRSQTT